MVRSRLLLAFQLAVGALFATGQVRAAAVLEYNFGGGADGQLVSGDTGGATVGTLDSSVDHPNTLVDSVRGGTLLTSRIKHWSDSSTTETEGGNFVGMTYDTTLPPGAEGRAGYDGNAVQFVRSGVLHDSGDVPGSNTAFSVFTRIYWEDSSLSTYETLFGSGSSVGQHDPTTVSKWWVGIDSDAKRLTWNFNGDPSVTFPVDGPELTANTWTDVAITFSGDGRAVGPDTLKVYIDGELKTTAEGETSFTPAVGSLRDDWSFWPAENPLTSTLQVGGSYRGVAPYYGEAFVGLMERFVYFNDVLSDAQVAALTTAPPAGPGDFDGDLDVDGDDFLVWQRTDGTPTGLTAWKDNFGLAASGVAASAVPEPTAALLMGSFVGCLMIARRRL